MFPLGFAISSINWLASLGGNKDDRPTTPVIIKGADLLALYDTGAGVSALSHTAWRKIPRHLRPEKVPCEHIELETCAHHSLKVKGMCEFPIQILGRKLRYKFFIIENLSSEVILGRDFMRQFGLSYDAISNGLFFQEGRAWCQASMIAKETVTIPARSTKNISVECQINPGERATGPSAAVASVSCQAVPLAGMELIVNVGEDGKTLVQVDNLTDCELELPRNTFIGELSKVNEDHIAEVCPDKLRVKGRTLDMSKDPVSEAPDGSACPDPVKREFLISSVREQTSHLSPSLQKKYIELILRNHDVFSKDKFDLGRTNCMEHSVHLRDRDPVFRKQFRIPEAHRSVLLEHLNNWLKLGVVKPCNSRYNSPIFLVPKKDGSLRPVLDFRGVNEKSFCDKYAQREVQDCLDELGRSQSKIFSGLDLTAGFWQLPLSEDSQEFTAFTIPGRGSFMWLMTPMGLLGSPASFGRMMEYVMRGLSAIVYQDDVLIHSKTHEEHLVHLQQAFDRLRGNGLKLNVKKCAFGQVEIAYLGFTLTSKGVLPGKDKTKAIREFPPPETIRQVREFVGLCNFFRNAVKDFAQISKPLTVLTGQKQSWKEGPLPKPALEAFHKLKQALLSPPVLAYPDPSKDYHLLVDASQGSEECPGGLGATLVQMDNDGNPHPIGYASRGLAKHERNYTAYLLELQSCVFGISFFDTYLRGKKFYLYTDHKPLTPLSQTHTKTLNRLQQLMLEFQFVILHKPGTENGPPDFLSRNPISSVDIRKPDLVELQSKDPQISKVKADLLSDSKDPKFLKIKENFVIKSDIVFHQANGRLSIFAPLVLRPQIIKAAHDSAVGGHMGIFKTSERILERYFWPGIHKDVEGHIAKCDPCRKAKPYRREVKPPLRPLPAALMPNSRLHCDLYGPLSTSEKGKKYVLVMTDAFTKYVELAAIKDKTAEEVVGAIMDYWITRYSTPREIVTDNGREFVNKVSKELFRRLQILHRQTTPYHPQCNAQAEQFNKTMTRYLRACLDPPYLDWELCLPALRISYNTSVSKATKASPFSLVFAMEPNMPFFELDAELNYDEDALIQMEFVKLARQRAREENFLYRKTYADYYDKKYKVEETKIVKGDYIYVTFPPQQKFKNPKLQPLCKGPFKVEDVRDVTVTFWGDNGKLQKAHVERCSKIILDDWEPPTNLLKNSQLPMDIEIEDSPADSVARDNWCPDSFWTVLDEYGPAAFQVEQSVGQGGAVPKIRPHSSGSQNSGAQNPVMQTRTNVSPQHLENSRSEAIRAQAQKDAESDEFQVMMKARRDQMIEARKRCRDLLSNDSQLEEARAKNEAQLMAQRNVIDQARFSQFRPTQQIDSDSEPEDFSILHGDEDEVLFSPIQRPRSEVDLQTSQMDVDLLSRDLAASFSGEGAVGGAPLPAAPGEDTLLLYGSDLTSQDVTMADASRLLEDTVVSQVPATPVQQRRAFVPPATPFPVPMLVDPTVGKKRKVRSPVKGDGAADITVKPPTPKKKSLADLLVEKVHKATRSKGPVQDLPLPKYPHGSKADLKEQQRQRAQQEQGEPTVAAGPSSSPPSCSESP